MATHLNDSNDFDHGPAEPANGHAGSNGTNGYHASGESGATAVVPVSQAIVRRAGRSSPPGAMVPASAGGMELYDPQAQAGGDEGAQIDLVGMLWRRKWTIVLLTLLGAAGGYGALQVSPPSYESTGQVYLPLRNANLIGENEIIGGGLSSSKFGLKILLETQAQLMKQNAVLNLALARPEMQASVTLRDEEDKAKALRDALRVRPVENTQVMTVTATTSDPKDAQLFVEQTINAYRNLVLRQFGEGAEDTIASLKTALLQAEADLSELNNTALKIRKQVNQVSSVRGVQTLPQSELFELQKSLLQAKAAEGELASVRAAADAAAAAGDTETLNATLPPAPGQSESSRLKAQLDMMERALARAERSAGSGSRRVISIRQEVDDLRQDVFETKQQEMQGRLEAIRLRHDYMKRRVAELEKEVDDQLLVASSDEIQLAELRSVEESITRQSGFIADINRQLSKGGVGVAAGAEEPQVILPAQPGVQVAPVPVQLIGMGAALGLMLGLGLAFLREWMDPRLRSAQEAEDLLGLPVLGAVPTLDRKASNSEKARLMLDRPKAHEAEAYRDVRTVLSAALADCVGGDRAAVTDDKGNTTYDCEGRTVLVTSPVTGDGKTTLATNLAASFARMGRRTLLIDADCRRPQIGSIVLGEEENEAGLTSVLTGQYTLDEATRRVPQLANLDVLPCGPLPQDPAEMLNSDKFLDLLDRVAADYDKVVIDSPPVLPVTDARVLGAVCDATVLVLRGDQSTRRNARQAADGLRRTGATLVGLVVNDVKKSGRSFGGQYDYAYGYEGPSEGYLALPEPVAGNVRRMPGGR